MTIAWIYLDKKTAAVDALKDYASMEYIIQNHPVRLDEANEQMTAAPAASLTGTPKARNPQAGETRLAATLDEIDVLKERYRSALEYMDWFRPAWDALTDDEQYILTEFFLNECTKTDAVKRVSQRLYVERSQVYFRKDKAVSHLALLLYGK